MSGIQRNQNGQQASTLYLLDDFLVLDFPFDESRVNQIKKIQGAKWDKLGKVWRVPVSSLERAREFALQHDFQISNEVLAFNMPLHLNPGDGISVDGDYFILSFKYDQVMVRSVKQIDGITWDADTKAWRAPLSASQSVIKWANTFRQELSDDVMSVANGIVAELSALREASRSTDAEINITTLNGSLLPYQRAGIAYAANARRSFIADEMGLGKTLQAMATLEYLHQDYENFNGFPSYPAVVVCPPNLVLNWKNEYNRFFPERIVEVCLNRKQIPMFGTYDVVVIGYSNLAAWEKNLMKHNAYVFDESHYCKSMDAQRTRAARKIVKSASASAVVLCLTGTPVTNRPAEYAPQLDIIGRLDKFGGLWGFYRRYCAAYRDKWGQWHLEGNSNLEELNDKLRSTCYIRRTKDQVMQDLPPVVHNPLLVDGNPSIMKEYSRAQADIVNYLVEQAKRIAAEMGLPVGNAAVKARLKAEAHDHLLRISVLRKIAAKAKMDMVHEWIDERISEGRKVVVAAHHREIVNELADKYGGLKIQGQMDVQTVEDMKYKFQTASCEDAPVIVLSIQAAKTGHTLTASQDVLFVELPWTPADVDQTYSRCHRIGQKGSVTATYMMTNGTIDQEIYSLIDKKRSVIDIAVDGDTVFDSTDATNIIFSLLDSAP